MKHDASNLSAMTISVRSTAVQQAGPDPQLTEIASQAKAAGEPITLRLAPQLYRPEGKAYAGWRDTIWTVGVPGAVEAELVREALGAFFDAVATGELVGLIDALRVFKSEQVGGGR